MQSLTHLDDHEEGTEKSFRRYPRLPIRRYPRRNAESVAFYRTANLIAELEKKAHDWFARGREANIEVGRILIRLKPLVGHGNFQRYYELKYGKPYRIAFRTAQVYMQLARKADEETKGADPALFPPATDSQAMAIREATEKARLAVRAADAHSSNESTTSTDAHVRNDSPKYVSSMCTCRLYIRMTTEQRDTISKMWRSEHRHSAETKVTNYLMELCAECEISGNDSAESRD